MQVNQQMSFSEQVVSMFAVDILFTVHGAGLTTSADDAAMPRHAATSSACRTAF